MRQSEGPASDPAKSIDVLGTDRHGGENRLTAANFWLTVGWPESNTACTSVAKEGGYNVNLYHRSIERGPIDGGRALRGRSCPVWDGGICQQRPFETPA